MMNEVKYRARIPGSENWVEGNIAFTQDGKNYIGCSRSPEVDWKPEITLFQVPEIFTSTGALDVQGVEIFEGDYILLPKTDFSDPEIREVRISTAGISFFNPFREIETFQTSGLRCFSGVKVIGNKLDSNIHTLKEEWIG